MCDETGALCESHAQCVHPGHEPGNGSWGRGRIKLKLSLHVELLTQFPELFSRPSHCAPSAARRRGSIHLWGSCQTLPSCGRVLSPHSLALALLQFSGDCQRHVCPLSCGRGGSAGYRCPPEAQGPWQPCYSPLAKQQNTGLCLKNPRDLHQVLCNLPAFLLVHLLCCEVFQFFVFILKMVIYAAVTLPF